MIKLFTVRPGRSTLREVSDQVLHAVYAGGLFLVIYYSMTPVQAGLISFGLGVLRELEQKKWAWREMGQQDLFFWGASSLAFTVAYILAEFL